MRRDVEDRNKGGDKLYLAGVATRGLRPGPYKMDFEDDACPDAAGSVVFLLSLAVENEVREEGEKDGKEGQEFNVKA